MIEHPIDVLAKYLQDNGMSASELAKRMGISPAFMSDALNHKRCFGAKTWAKAADAMGKDDAWAEKQFIEQCRLEYWEQVTRNAKVVERMYKGNRK